MIDERLIDDAVRVVSGDGRRIERDNKLDVRLESTSPVFLVSDIATTMRWYADHLGFAGDPFPPSPPYVFCILRRDDIEIMLQALPGYEKPDSYAKRRGGVWDVYVRMTRVSELYELVSKRTEITIVEPLHRQPYGQTEFAVRDPNGYVLVFAEET